MTTEPARGHFSRRRTAGAATTATAAVVTGLTVGWAAAHPVGTGSTQRPAPSHADDGRALDHTARQIAAARTSLAHVRAELTRLLGDEDRLPRAAVPSGSSLPVVPPAQNSVQLPAAPAAVAPPPVAVAPPTQATTGASGAH